MIPASARGRLGLLAILAVFLVPISVSWLGGLTQAVTCDDRARSTLAVSTTARHQASSASAVGSMRRAPTCCARAITAVMCAACSCRMCTKFTEFAFCIGPSWNRLGNP